MAELSPGSEFAGHRIEGIAGRGGFGVVYRARHLALDHIVALKLISSARAGDEAFRERFKSESRIAVSIRHPNVVAVHNAGEEDGLLFVTMDFIEGTDLRGLLNREGRLEPDDVVDVVSQVASALDAAHAKGLVHRDIKPGNVLIGERDGIRHVYLTDFGLSKQMDATSGLTASGAFVGTLDYSAPEQIRGGRLDARTDVYALACVAFELLSGEAPFASQEDNVAKLYAHLQEPPPELASVAPRGAARALGGRPARLVEGPGRPPSIGRGLRAGRGRGGRRPRDRPRPSATSEWGPRRRRRPSKRSPRKRPSRPSRPRCRRRCESRESRRARLRVTTLRHGSPAHPRGEAPQGAARRRGSRGRRARSRSMGLDWTEDRRKKRMTATRRGGGASGGLASGDSFDVPAQPVGIAIDDGTVWVSSASGQALTRLDAETGEEVGKPLDLGGAGGQIAFTDDGDAWVTVDKGGGAGSVSAVRTGRRPSRERSRWTPDQAGSRPVPTFVWVANSGSNTTSRLNPVDERGRSEPFRALTSRRGVVAGNADKAGNQLAKGIWITNSGRDSVTRITAEGEIVSTVAGVGANPIGIVIASDELVWVAAEGDNALTHDRARARAGFRGRCRRGREPYGVSRRRGLRRAALAGRRLRLGVGHLRRERHGRSRGRGNGRVPGQRGRSRSEPRRPSRPTARESG